MISEERLKEAARRCEEHMLNCLPDPSECKATFSPRFEQKMKRLFAVCLFSMQLYVRQFSDRYENPYLER